MLQSFLQGDGLDASNIEMLYVLGAATLIVVLAVYRPATTWPGFVLVLLGVPVYFLWRRPAKGLVNGT